MSKPSQRQQGERMRRAVERTLVTAAPVSLPPFPHDDHRASRLLDEELRRALASAAATPARFFDLFVDLTSDLPPPRQTLEPLRRAVVAGRWEAILPGKYTTNAAGLRALQHGEPLEGAVYVPATSTDPDEIFVDGALSAEAQVFGYWRQLGRCFARHLGLDVRAQERVGRHFVATLRKRSIDDARRDVRHEVRAVSVQMDAHDDDVITAHGHSRTLMTTRDTALELISISEF